MAILKREETSNTRSAVPTAPSAEKAAISILLQNYEVLDAAKWDADLFFEHANRALLSAAKECHNEGYKSDIFRLQAVLEEKGSIFDVGGYHGVTEAFATYPVGNIAEDAAKKAACIDLALDFRKDLLKARRYRKAMAKLAESRDDIREMRADLNGIAQHLADSDEEQTDAVSLKKQCADLLTELLKTTPPERFTTGVNGLDERINGGFERGTLAVFASETSGGKSIALLQTALHGALNAKNGVIFSLEMSATQVIGRLVAAQSGWRCVSAYEKPSQPHVNGMKLGIADISALPITIHDQVSDIDTIESICRQLKRTGLDWVVVDYIQLCSPSADSKSETREQQVSEVVRRLKLMALHLNVCVLTASQLNDKGELRESRGIGHHADYVLHIDHANHPDIEIKLMKNRNGERHVSAPVIMQGGISRFVDRVTK
jgi:replicative DNA helicase